MIDSFMNRLLPKDEYKRLSTIYFLAESAFIVLLAFICLTIVHLFFYDLYDALDILLLCVTFFMIIYPAARYVLSGMEYDDVMDQASYKESRRKGIVQTLGTGGMFFIVFLLVNRLKEGPVDILSIILVPLFFTIIFGAFTMISLKKSYNKNKELE